MNMNKRLSSAILGGTFLGFLLAAPGVFAAPTPPELKPGPTYIKFDGRQQISPTGSITYESDGQTFETGESAWGLVNLSTIATGVVEAGRVTQDETYWSSGGDNGGIRGMFYGFEPTTDPATALPSSGGTLDLYFFTEFRGLGGTDPGDRSAIDQFPDFTDGQLLVSIDFASGITGDPDTTLRGNQEPAEDSFAGDAQGYGVVNQEAGALWADQFESFFETAFGMRDFFFNNRYEGFEPWDGDAVGDEGEQLVFGATLDDPLQAYVVPTPSTVMLMGLGLLTLVWLRPGALRRLRERVGGGQQGPTAGDRMANRDVIQA